MENRKIFFTFLYNLRSCKEDKDNKEKLQRKRVRIEGFQEWDWDSMQLSIYIAYNLGMQLWEGPCVLHLPE